MTTTNTTPTPTQRVEQVAFDAYHEISALPLLHTDAVCAILEKHFKPIATELEAAQKSCIELAKWKGREPEIYQHKETRRRAIITSCDIDGGNDSGEPMDVIDSCIKDLRQQLEAAQKELVMLRKATIDLDAEQHLLRQQLADMKLECEELDAIRKIILDHIGYATVTQNTIKEIIAENAELKKDKERCIKAIDNLLVFAHLNCKPQPIQKEECDCDDCVAYRLSKELRTTIDAARKEQS